MPLAYHRALHQIQMGCYPLGCHRVEGWQGVLWKSMHWCHGLSWQAHHADSPHTYIITDTQRFSYSQGQRNPGCYTICYWQGPLLKQTLLICCIFQLSPPSLHVLWAIQMCRLWLCYVFYPRSVDWLYIVYLILFSPLRTSLKLKYTFIPGQCPHSGWLGRSCGLQKTRCIMTQVTFDKQSLKVPTSDAWWWAKVSEELCLPFAMMHLNGHCSSTSSAVTSCTSCKYP